MKGSRCNYYFWKCWEFVLHFPHTDIEKCTQRAHTFFINILNHNTNNIIPSICAAVLDMYLYISLWKTKTAYFYRISTLIWGARWFICKHYQWWYQFSVLTQISLILNLLIQQKVSERMRMMIQNWFWLLLQFASKTSIYPSFTMKMFPLSRSGAELT